MPSNLLRRPSPLIGACLFAGLCCSCAERPVDAPGSLEAKAREMRVSLPSVGVGPIKQFAIEGVQSGIPSKRVIYFEWPDGTEELRGRTYDRTKITTVESRSVPFVEFRYQRRDGERILGIEGAELGFGEYFVRPADLTVGKQWRSNDKSEVSDCRVVDAKAVEVGARHYDHCLEIRCEQETTMPDGEVFKGTTITHRCRGIGVVQSRSESSNGRVNIGVYNFLENYSWNGIEPPDAE